MKTQINNNITLKVIPFFQYNTQNWQYLKYIYIEKKPHKQKMEKKTRQQLPTEIYSVIKDS